MQDQQRQLTAYLERWLDDIHAACNLTQLQRQTLALAGKLDLEKLRAEIPPLEKLAEGEKLVVQKTPLAVGQARLPSPCLHPCPSV